MTFPLGKAANQFAVDFFHCYVRRHGDKHKNLILCPYLIFQSLAMLLVGARGNTAAQLIKLLRIPANLGAQSRANSNQAPVSPASLPIRRHRESLELTIDRYRTMPRFSSASSLMSCSSSSASIGSSRQVSPSVKCTRKSKTQSLRSSNSLLVETSTSKRRFVCDAVDEARHREMLMLTEQLLHGNFEIVHLASFIYLDKSVKRTEAFKAILRDYYETKPKKIEFDKPLAMTKTINEDVARTTENIYQEILSLQEASKCDKTFMLLVNAIFFRGFWQSNFTDIEKRTFTRHPSKLLDKVPSGISIPPTPAEAGSNSSPKPISGPVQFQVNMMSKVDYLTVINDTKLDARIIRLPFEASDLQMLVVLPNNSESDSTYLCKTIAADKINAIARAFVAAQPQYVKVTMPIFCVDSGKISIQSTLVKMGAGDLFDKNKSDMSGLCETKPIWLHKILHRCFIICDNRGAITSSGTEMARKRQAILDKASQRVEIVDFTADHPFLYIIMDTVTRTILLIGQYTDPSETLEVVHENQLSPEEAHQIYTECVYKT